MRGNLSIDSTLTVAAGAAAGSPAEAAKERAGAGGGRFDVELAGVEVFDRERAVIGPDHVRELGEDAVEVEGVRLGERMESRCRRR